MLQLPGGLQTGERVSTSPTITGRWGIFLLSILAAILITGSPSRAQVPHGTITSSVNVVVARNGISGAEIVGRIGVVLVNGDSVRTGPRSAAGIAFQDGTVLRLGELTNVVVHPGAVHNIEVTSGSLYGQFRGPGQVSGRYALAAVRGTKLVFTATTAGNTIACYPDGAGTHSVDVAAAGTHLISGVVTGVNGLAVRSDVLVGQTQDWTGASFRSEAAGGTPNQIPAAAFDPATGTVTLQQAPAAPLAVGTPFTLINPANAPVVDLQPGYETHVSSAPGSLPTAPVLTANLPFALGAEFPSFQDNVPGQDVQTHLTGPAYERFRQSVYLLQTEQERNTEVGLLTPGIQVGSLHGTSDLGNINIDIGSPASSRSYSNVYLVSCDKWDA